MRITHLTSFAAAAVSLTGCVALLATTAPVPDLKWIERLNATVQERFEDPVPPSLGMSRLVRRSSFGSHFRPDPKSYRDFYPESPAEQALIAALEERQVQAGLYLFGTAISASAATERNFRALKGPAILTHGTLRPAWYPSAVIKDPWGPQTNGDALPDWNAIYPLARKAMESFDEGGRGFETVFGSWNIAVRPVVATQERCVACHNNPAYHPTRVVKLNEVIGGVMYAYRSPVD